MKTENKNSQAIGFCKDGKIIWNEDAPFGALFEKRNGYESMVLDDTNPICRIKIVDQNYTFWDSNLLDSVLVKKILELHRNTPDGVIQDADTILVDFMEEGLNAAHENGIAEELFSIWERSCDKYAIELVFELFTGKDFHCYLLDCVEQITRNPIVKGQKQGETKCM